MQWIYEHLRQVHHHLLEAFNHADVPSHPFAPHSRLPQDLNPLITSLLPICNRQSCPEMKAGEWQYLCVAHADGGGKGGDAAVSMIVGMGDSQG